MTQWSGETTRPRKPTTSSRAARSRSASGVGVGSVVGVGSGVGVGVGTGVAVGLAEGVAVGAEVGLGVCSAMSEQPAANAPAAAVAPTTNRRRLIGLCVFSRQ